MESIHNSPESIKYRVNSLLLKLLPIRTEVLPSIGFNCQRHCHPISLLMSQTKTPPKLYCRIRKNVVIRELSWSLRCKSHAEVLVYFMSVILQHLRRTGLPTLPPNFIEEIDHDLILSYSKAIEVFSDGSRQLFLALPSLLLVPGHCRRHPANGRLGQNSLVGSFVESSRSVQPVVVSIAVQY